MLTLSFCPDYFGNASVTAIAKRDFCLPFGILFADSCFLEENPAFRDRA